jgi:hypothetical protein
VEHHGFEIYRHMSLLRESGLEFVGMSLVGPSIAIVTDRSAAEVAGLIEPLGLEIAIETKVELKRGFSALAQPILTMFKIESL